MINLASNRDLTNRNESIYRGTSIKNTKRKSLVSNDTPDAVFLLPLVILKI